MCDWALRSFKIFLIALKSSVELGWMRMPLAVVFALVNETRALLIRRLTNVHLFLFWRIIEEILFFFSSHFGMWNEMV